jgi:hypothetical protein
MSRKAIPADTAGDVQAPPAPVRTPPAGFVECITTRPSWQGGFPAGARRHAGPAFQIRRQLRRIDGGRVCRVDSVLESALSLIDSDATLGMGSDVQIMPTRQIEWSIDNYDDVSATLRLQIFYRKFS